MSQRKNTDATCQPDNQDIFPDSSALEPQSVPTDPPGRVRKFSTQVDDTTGSKGKRQKVKDDGDDVAVKPNQSKRRC